MAIFNVFDDTSLRVFTSHLSKSSENLRHLRKISDDLFLAKDNFNVANHSSVAVGSLWELCYDENGELILQRLAATSDDLRHVPDSVLIRAYYDLLEAEAKDILDISEMSSLNQITEELRRRELLDLLELK